MGKVTQLILLSGLLLFLPQAFATSPVAAAPLPENSVYRIPSLMLRDQRGEVFAFASLRGQSLLVGMFYGSCKMVCPLEIEALKRIEHKVAPKRSIPIVLVSFDPANDDVAMLQKVAAEHHVQAPLFRLTRPEQGDEGMLAGALGIAYRHVPGGGFSHNVVLALLDAEGRIVATSGSTGAPDPEFVAAILKLAAAR